MSTLEREDGFDKAIDEIAWIVALFPVYQTIVTTKDNKDINKVCKIRPFRKENRQRLL